MNKILTWVSKIMPEVPNRNLPVSDGYIHPCLGAQNPGMGNFYIGEDRTNSPDSSQCLPPADASLQGSPLILDLDGDGVEAGGVALFDHEGDGFAELSRWVGGDDGLLVWDRNGDGVINDGAELFGNNTPFANGNQAANGFAALADLDSCRGAKRVLGWEKG